MKISFSPHASEVLTDSIERARAIGHTYVGTEHILYAILNMKACSACSRLSALGLDPDDLCMEVQQMIGHGPNLKQKGSIPFTARTQKILELAGVMVTQAKRPVVDTSDLVVAILREGESVAAQILFARGLDAEKFYTGKSSPDAPHVDVSAQSTSTSQAQPQVGQSNASSARSKTPALNTFGRDLTAAAKKGELDPVIGRQQELKRMIQVLCRRTKNNAVLIGEAGVGKTAVVEGLAQAIAADEVPERMRHRRIVSIDMARIVAGTQYRGQFEERLKQILEESRRVGNVVLFLDEIHTLVGSGAAEGMLDAANILKPALSRGELQVVGATTFKEYHKSIEKDAALERRFQSIQVNEPSLDEAVAILAGVAPRYEEHHHVHFSTEALRAAVTLTARYLPARLLPDKAIDAIDETGSRVRIKNTVHPLDVKPDQAKVDEIRMAKEKAIAESDFEKAAHLRDEELAARVALDQKISEWKKEHEEQVIEITADDIAETISSISSVPVERMTESSAGKLLSIEKDLSQVVVGQNEAIASIARALRRARANLGDPHRPIGSFLFLGPTGVGKTLLAKMLAEHIYGDPKALITLDMTEFSNSYTSSRLVGAPPGYVGYDEGGQLTERVRRRPYSVVLFDEFEKASPEVMNMMLQLLEDGRLTDGQGRQVDFRNTIVIATANLGFDFAREGKSFGFSQETAATSYEALRAKLLEEAKRTFRPELLNRFDESVVFRKLEKTDIATILNLELAPLRARLSARDMTLELTPEASQFICAKGADEALGARPLRRAVQQCIEDPLADLLLREKLMSGRITVTCTDGQFAFTQLHPVEDAH